MAAHQEAERESAVRKGRAEIENARGKADAIRAEARAFSERERGAAREARRLAAAIKDAAEREGGALLEGAREGARLARESGERESGRVMDEVEATLAAAQLEAARIVEAAENAAAAVQAGAALAAAAAAAGGLVRVLFYGELEAATEGFSSERRIGGGGFGNVFKAVGLAGAGECAVKRLKEGSMQGQLEFLQEVQVLGGCCHTNLLPLLGFSADRASGAAGGGVCLVSPLMRGGSLEDRLFPLGNGASARLALLGVPPQVFPAAWFVIQLDALPVTCRHHCSRIQQQCLTPNN